MRIVFLNYAGGVALALVVFLAVVAMGADDGRVDVFSDGFRVGSDGTKMDLLHAGTVDVPNGATTGVVTVTSVLPGDLAIVTPNESLGSAAKFFAVASTDTLTVTVNADPATTVTFNYLVIGSAGI